MPQADVGNVLKETKAKRPQRKFLVLTFIFLFIDEIPLKSKCILGHYFYQALTTIPRGIFVGNGGQASK